MTSEFEYVDDTKTYKTVFCIGLICLLCLLIYGLYTGLKKKGGLKKIFCKNICGKEETFVFGKEAANSKTITGAASTSLIKKLGLNFKTPEEKAVETLTKGGKNIMDNEKVAETVKKEMKPHLIKETVAELEQRIKAIDDQLAVTDPKKVPFEDYDKTNELKLKLETEKAELEAILKERKKQDALFGETKAAEGFDNCTMFSTAAFNDDYNKHIFAMSSDRINIPYITNQEDIDDRKGTISSLEDTQSNYNKYKNEENNYGIGNIEINKDDVIHTDKEQQPQEETKPPYHGYNHGSYNKDEEDPEQRPVIPEFDVDYGQSSFPEVGYNMDYRKDTQYKLAQYAADAAQNQQYQSWMDQKHINYSLQDMIEDN